LIPTVFSIPDGYIPIGNMQTAIVAPYKNTPEGTEADEILRACVHCGLCTATCPSYQLLGDERDSPRGRIYLIKQALEGQPISRMTQRHLDRCLTCTSCETTCPSGVRYRHLLHIGRRIVDGKVSRPLHQRLQRLVLRKVLPYPKRFSPLLRLARGITPILPDRFKVPSLKGQNGPVMTTRANRRNVLILSGCVQSVATPGTNVALARIFQRIGIGVIHEPRVGCCGAVSYHLTASIEAAALMRHNIDAWWPHVESGIEAIVVSATGCGAMVKDYGYLFRNDPKYAEKAARISSLVRDPVELLAQDEQEKLSVVGNGRRIAFHAPCTLQHRLRLTGRVESILTRLGFVLTPVADAHLCCGSAGTYSLLQPELSQRLRTRKLSHLQQGKPELIATANVGCQLHLAHRAEVPVIHWLELLE